MKNILVATFGKLGDTVVKIPSLRLIRSRYPNSKIIILDEKSFSDSSFVSSKDVLGGSCLVDEFIPFPLVSNGILSKISKAFRILFLRFKRIDLGVVLTTKYPNDLPTQLRLKRVCQLAGAKRIYCDENPIVPIRQDSGRYYPVQNVVEQLFEITKEALVIKDNIKPSDYYEFPTINTSRLEAANLLNKELASGKRLVIFATGANVPAKKWPLERYLEVFTQLKKYRNIHACFLASKLEEKDITACFHSQPGISFFYGLSIPTVAEIFRLSSLYIGNDTGLAHLAAATGLPGIAIHAARNVPGAWYPYSSKIQVIRRSVNCEGCQLAECIEEKMKCLLSIEVDEVLTAAMKKI